MSAFVIIVAVGLLACGFTVVGWYLRGKVGAQAAAVVKAVEQPKA